MNPLTDVCSTISEEDCKFDDYINSQAFQDYASMVRQEYREGKGVTLRCAEDINKWFDRL